MTPTGKPAQILQLLKTGGELSVRELADELNISTVGTRQHLLRLEQEGLVDQQPPAKDQRTGAVGRPTQYWQLTPDASRHFPDRHQELGVELVEGVRQLFGDEGLRQLIDGTRQETVRRYRQLLSGCNSLEEQIQTLARLRCEAGYMAQVIPLDSGESWLLIENHCPVSAVARSCQGLCRSERELFSDLLEAAVEPVDHLLQGDRRCSWLISPRRRHKQLSLL